jgi:hypothetical protein
MPKEYEYNEGKKAQKDLKKAGKMKRSTEIYVLQPLKISDVTLGRLYVLSATYSRSPGRNFKISSGSGLFRQSASTLAHKIFPSGCTT